VPFLRVLRDKRGYETTYLMHWFRDGNRQRSRILYVFRTPPGVKVGRDAIDPGIIREIEAQHPDIEFDWRALRENQQVIDNSLEQRRPRKPRKEDKEKTRPAPERPPAERPRREAVQAGGPPGGEIAWQPPLVIPTAIEGTTREDQFVFLLKTYLNLRDRVPHRTHDPIRRESLAALVERLNPEAWVGEEAVVAGLQDAAEALQRLSSLSTKRRKRSRRPQSDRSTAADTSDAVVQDIEGSGTTDGRSDPAVSDTDGVGTNGEEPESDPFE
jgi:hypothetical protein